VNNILVLIIIFINANACAHSPVLNDYLQDATSDVKPLANSSFVKPQLAEKSEKTNETEKTINAIFTINSMDTGKYFKVIKDDYKTSKNPRFQVSKIPEINIHLWQKGSKIYPQSSAFFRNSHPQWEWQISQGVIWQSESWQENNSLLKIVLPFSLQEKNANCTHNGYMVLAQLNNETNWSGYFQITGETCAYLQFDLAAHLQVKARKSTDTFAIKTPSPNKTYTLTDLKTDYPQLDISKLRPNNPATNTTSGLFIKGKHYQISCQNRTGNDPYCQQLALPSYSTAKSLFAGTALMRLEKLIPNISRVSVHKLIPKCDKKRWGKVSLADLLNMRTGNYLSKKPHVDENSQRMLDFFLAETHQQKLKMACTMFKHKSTAGKHFVYHSSDTYLAGVIMNKVFQQISHKEDLFNDFMLKDLWKNLTLSDLFASSKRTYDDSKQAFTGWGLSYYVDDLIQLINFLQHNHKLFDDNLYNSALQRGDKRLNLGGGEANMAYNNGFWALEVGHSLHCKKPKWLPFMSGFGGISIVLYQPDIFYYSFADDHQYQWLKVVKELNKQFPLCANK
jgi:hypothetical protein